MMTSHPIRTLESALDDKRLQLIEKLATDKSISADAMKELATVQTASTAVREALVSTVPEWVGAAIRS
jgi:hypothetical protein